MRSKSVNQSTFAFRADSTIGVMARTKGGGQLSGIVKNVQSNANLASTFEEAVLL